MEIAEIKAELRIGQVLEHYSLKADKSWRLNCPFHDDKTPSMQVYTETDTVYCFSSRCRLHGKAVDAIDFIMHMENVSKHEALVKAKELLGFKVPDQPYEKLYRVFLTNLKKSEKAKEYLQQRGIDKTEAGFNDGQWDHLKHCVVFGLRDRKDKIVSLYGRSIYSNSDAKHYYTRNRKGLYPGYPKSTAKQLVLTEAVIDAATIGQHTNYTPLACYGTNGFTAEHEVVIKELKHLEEVILFFDGDDAGREGIKRIAHKIKQINDKLKISVVDTPDEEDVNSLVHSHEAGILNHLIENRKPFIFSPEITAVKPQLANQLDASNPLKLTYKTPTANYHVKGGLRNEADSMRVSLDIEHPANGRKSRE